VQQPHRRDAPRFVTTDFITPGFIAPGLAPWVTAGLSGAAHDPSSAITVSPPIMV